jgi:ribose transport system ATP-binding protein
MTPLLSVSGLSKSFAGVKVLSDVDFDIREGEIHALLGANGSGKSTLIKILSGYHDPDPGGQLTVRGEPVDLPLRPGGLASLGIAFVHQNLALAGDMSLVDNLSVGQYTTRWGKIDWRSQIKKVESELDEYGLREDVRKDVSKLSSASKMALVAIARALGQINQSGGSGVLVLDEPTVYLPAAEVRHLHATVRNLTKRGVGVLYVTHRLDELRGFADRVTVLRDGLAVGSSDTASLTDAELIRMITGGLAATTIPKTTKPQGSTEVLRVSNLWGGVISDFSLSVRKGEIVGLVGLVGMGQEDVLGLLYGVAAPSGGSMSVNENPVKNRPSACMDSGIYFVPADRARYSAALSETVATNVTLPILSRFVFRGRLRRNKEAAYVLDLLRQFDVRPGNPDALMGGLSGGNQQKAIMGKWLQMSPQVLLLDEPVQGVDVGARVEIFDRLREAAIDGCAILVASSDYGDMAKLCDRVLIMRDGQVVVELSGSDVTSDNIASACYASVLSDKH